jgi:polyisoprenoid-binding protein YceI
MKGDKLKVQRAKLKGRDSLQMPMGPGHVRHTLLIVILLLTRGRIRITKEEMPPTQPLSFSTLRRPPIRPASAPMKHLVPSLLLTEPIHGSANGISGKVTFDPASPGSVKGAITIAAASLQVPNPVMKEHLDGGQWLDVKKFPAITFTAESAANVKTEGNVTTAAVSGTMTIKGVTKKLSVPVKLTYLKDRLRDRGGMKPVDGDLLVLRAVFTVKRADFDINPGKFEDKVANDIEITLGIAGAAPRKP